MTNDRVDREIEAIERFLHDDDPALWRRFHDLQRADFRSSVTVFALLALGAVLLVVGLANLSFAAIVTGGVAFAAASLVDHMYRRQLGLAPQPEIADSDISRTSRTAR